MIIAYFLRLLTTLVMGVCAGSQAVDIHLDTNSYFLAAWYYARTLDQFLPITNAVLPLLVVSGGIQTFFLVLRVIRAIKIAGFGIS